jgi:hypothetical protein
VAAALSVRAQSIQIHYFSTTQRMIENLKEMLRMGREEKEEYTLWLYYSLDRV